MDFNLLWSDLFGSNPIGFQSTWIQSIRVHSNWISIYSDPIHSGPIQLDFNLLGSNLFGSDQIGFKSTRIQSFQIQSNWISIYSDPTPLDSINSDPIYSDPTPLDPFYSDPTQLDPICSDPEGINILGSNLLGSDRNKSKWICSNNFFHKDTIFCPADGILKTIFTSQVFNILYKNTKQNIVKTSIKIH